MREVWLFLFYLQVGGMMDVEHKVFIPFWLIVLVLTLLGLALVAGNMGGWW